MTITLKSNATMAKAILVFNAENGLTNMVDASAITVTGTMASGTAGGHTVLGDGAALNNFLSGIPTNSIAANEVFSILAVGHFGLDPANAGQFVTSPTNGWFLKSSWPSSIRSLQLGNPYWGTGDEQPLTDNTSNSTRLYTLIGGRDASGKFATVMEGTYHGGTAGDATVAGQTISNGAWKFGGSVLSSGAASGFGIYVFAVFKGLAPTDLNTYLANNVANMFDVTSPNISATLNGNASTTASLTTNIILSSSVSSLSTVTATLFNNGISASVTSVSSIVAGLTTAIKLAASAVGLSSVSPALTTFPAIGFDTPVLKNNTGQLLTGETGITINIYNNTTGALVLRKTGLISDATTAIVQVRDTTGALVATTVYSYEVVLTSNGRRLPTATAA